MMKRLTTAALCAALTLSPMLAPTQAQAAQLINNNNSSSDNKDIAATLIVLGVVAMLLSRNGGFASSKSEKAPNSTGAKGRILQKF